VWNWRHLLIIFLTSFPIVLRRTIGWYDLGESNVALLGLGMTTIIEVLKWVGQCSSSMQVLAILMNLLIQFSSLIIDLIWLYVSLSGPGTDELLHFSIALIILFLENDFYLIVGLSEISSRKWILTSLSWAKLKDLWRVFHRSSNSMHSYPSYWIASITGSLHFLTQFIIFHGPHFLFAILSIFFSKKNTWISWPYFWNPSEFLDCRIVNIFVVYVNNLCSPPCFGISCYIDHFQIFEPNVFNIGY